MGRHLADFYRTHPPTVAELESTGDWGVNRLNKPQNTEQNNTTLTNTDCANDRTRIDCAAGSQYAIEKG